jgi:hypothetical protein
MTMSQRPTRASRPLLCRWAVRLATVLVLIAGGFGLAACGATMASMPLIGEPKNAPPRPEGPQTFPGVFVETAKPTESKMTAAERDKLKADLITTRDSAAARTREAINKPSPAKPSAKPKKQATSPRKCDKEPCPQ